MSGPVDTDSFVSAELDLLGVDLMTLEPITEEDPADYKDAMDTIANYDTKDNELGHIVQTKSPALSADDINDNGMHDSTQRLVKEAYESTDEIDALSAEEQRRDEEIKSDASRGHDSSDSHILDDADAVTIEADNSTRFVVGEGNSIDTDSQEMLGNNMKHIEEDSSTKDDNNQYQEEKMLPINDNPENSQSIHSIDPHEAEAEKENPKDENEEEGPMDENAPNGSEKQSKGEYTVEEDSPGKEILDVPLTDDSESEQLPLEKDNSGNDRDVDREQMSPDNKSFADITEESALEGTQPKNKIAGVYELIHDRPALIDQRFPHKIVDQIGDDDEKPEGADNDSPIHRETVGENAKENVAVEDEAEPEEDSLDERTERIDDETEGLEGTDNDDAHIGGVKSGAAEAVVVDDAAILMAAKPEEDVIDEITEHVENEIKELVCAENGTTRVDKGVTAGADVDVDEDVLDEAIEHADDGYIEVEVYENYTPVDEETSPAGDVEHTAVEDEAEPEKDSPPDERTEHIDDETEVLEGTDNDDAHIGGVKSGAAEAVVVDDAAIFMEAKPEEDVIDEITERIDDEIKELVCGENGNTRVDKGVTAGANAEAHVEADADVDMDMDVDVEADVYLEADVDEDVLDEAIAHADDKYTEVEIHEKNVPVDGETAPAGDVEHAALEEKAEPEEDSPPDERTEHIDDETEVLEGTDNDAEIGGDTLVAAEAVVVDDAAILMAAKPEEDVIDEITEHVDDEIKELVYGENGTTPVDEGVTAGADMDAEADFEADVDEDVPDEAVKHADDEDIEVEIHENDTPVEDGETAPAGDVEHAAGVEDEAEPEEDSPLDERTEYIDDETEVFEGTDNDDAHIGGETSVAAEAVVFDDAAILMAAKPEEDVIDEITERIDDEIKELVCDENGTTPVDEGVTAGADVDVDVDVEADVDEDVPDEDVEHADNEYIEVEIHEKNVPVEDGETALAGDVEHAAVEDEAEPEKDGPPDERTEHIDDETDVLEGTDNDDAHIGGDTLVAAEAVVVDDDAILMTVKPEEDVIYEITEHVDDEIKELVCGENGTTPIDEGVTAGANMDADVDVEADVDEDVPNEAVEHTDDENTEVEIHENDTPVEDGETSPAGDVEHAAGVEDEAEPEKDSPPDERTEHIDDETDVLEGSDNDAEIGGSASVAAEAVVVDDAASLMAAKPEEDVIDEITEHVDDEIKELVCGENGTTPVDEGVTAGADMDAEADFEADVDKDVLDEAIEHADDEYIEVEIHENDSPVEDGETAPAGDVEHAPVEDEAEPEKESPPDERTEHIDDETEVLEGSDNDAEIGGVKSVAAEAAVVDDAAILMAAKPEEDVIDEITERIDDEIKELVCDENGTTPVDEGVTAGADVDAYVDVEADVDEDVPDEAVEHADDEYIEVEIHENDTPVEAGETAPAGDAEYAALEDEAEPEKDSLDERTEHIDDETEVLEGTDNDDAHIGGVKSGAAEAAVIDDAFILMAAKPEEDVIDEITEHVDDEIKELVCDENGTTPVDEGVTAGADVDAYVDVEADVDEDVPDEAVEHADDEYIEVEIHENDTPVEDGETAPAGDVEHAAVEDEAEPEEDSPPDERTEHIDDETDVLEGSDNDAEIVGETSVAAEAVVVDDAAIFTEAKPEEDVIDEITERIDDEIKELVIYANSTPVDEVVRAGADMDADLDVEADMEAHVDEKEDFSDEAVERAGNEYTEVEIHEDDTPVEAGETAPAGDAEHAAVGEIEAEPEEDCREFSAESSLEESLEEMLADFDNVLNEGLDEEAAANVLAVANKDGIVPNEAVFIQAAAIEIKNDALEIDEQSEDNEFEDLRQDLKIGSDAPPLGMESHNDDNQTLLTGLVNEEVNDEAHIVPNSEFVTSAPSAPISQSDVERIDSLLDESINANDNNNGDDGSLLLTGDVALKKETDSALQPNYFKENANWNTLVEQKPNSPILTPTPVAKESVYVDQPKTTTLSFTGSHPSTKDLQHKPSQSILTARTASRSKSRSQSSGRSIHIQLYDRSITQQEEGKRRRHEVEDTLQKRADERSGKFSCHHKNCTLIYHHREHNNKKRENFRNEFLKSNTISISGAENLYNRLISHKQRTNEKKEQLRKDRELRDKEWLTKISKTKITCEDANRIYYRGIKNSR
eukprot:scaffold2135_cov271-Chaetoceros_neogracile.AAC.5